MALQSIKWGVTFPEIMDMFTHTFSASTIDASGEKVAFIFRVPKTGNIRKIVFRVNAVTTSETLRVGLQTVDNTSGNPTGSAYGGMTAGTQASPAAATTYAVTLGTDAAATKGDVVAAVIEFDSAVGNLTISTQYNSGFPTSFPYTLLNTTSWGRTGTHPVLGIEYDDGTYEPIACPPYSARGSVSFNSGSTPDERALRFQLPFPARVHGCWVYMTASATTADFDVVLYEGTTARVTQSIDASNMNLSSGSAVARFQFTSTYDLAANTEYFLAIKPTTANNLTWHEFDVPSAAAMDALPGGQAFHYAQRTDAGAWSTTTTKRPFMGLYLSAFGDDAGGGGLPPPIRVVQAAHTF